MSKLKKILKTHKAHTFRNGIKSTFLEWIDIAKLGECEMATFELQHALEMPFKTVEESYEWNQLWCSNVFVFDEERSKVFTYFWDESVAPRGPEQKACCLLRSILLNLPKNTKKN